MKQFNAVKVLLLITLFGVSGSVIGQTWHPYAFDSVNGNPAKNRYKDYVGQRVEVTNPTVVAGNKIYTISNDGSGGAGQWGGAITTPIVNMPVVMGIPDTFGCAPFTNFAAMSGKIALVWRGPLGGGACEFGYKALQAQNAGAIACVLINEYPGEGPVGMAAGASGGSVSIPVIMIGNLDGIALAAQYNSNPAGTVRMTLTPWGQNYNNDLGFVPGGYSIWHDYAIPFSMLGGENPTAYRCIDGAFVANFGTHNATNVKVKSSQTFTPTGGSAGAAHWDSISLASFPKIDSIWAMFAPAEYDLVAISTTGRYDLTYTISSDSTDDFAYDNSHTHSYYATDSVFSKGRYDVANQHVLTTQYFRVGGNYLWGVPYFVTRGGDAMKDVQFSMSTGVGLLPSSPAQNFYIFKWVDGSLGAGSLDSAMQGGELTLVGTCNKLFDGVFDSSQDYFNSSRISGDTTGSSIVPVKLDSNSWYYVAADMTPVSSTQFSFLGCDGELDFFPRTFGRKHFHNITELYNPVMDTDKNSMRLYAQSNTLTSIPFSGWGANGATLFVDSVIYSNQVGLIPNLALRITPYVIDHTNVNNTTQLTAKFEVFPNPASEYVNVTVDLSATAKNITYTILDGYTRVVAKETHSNIQNDKFTYSTSKLASGNYYIIVNADGKQMFKKFTVIK